MTFSIMPVVMVLSLMKYILKLSTHYAPTTTLFKKEDNKKGVQYCTPFLSNIDAELKFQKLIVNVRPLQVLSRWKILSVESARHLVQG